MRGIVFYPVVFVFLFVMLLSFTTEGLTMKDNGEKITKRQGSLIKVRPEYEERYIILHRHTFPGVLDRIRKSNIRNYSIFLLDGTLFSYLEYAGNNYEEDMKAIADPVTKDWWKLTDPMQEPLTTRKEGEWWAEMQQVFLLPEKNKESQRAIRVGLTAEILPGKEEEVKKICNSFPDELKKETYNSGFQNANMFMKDGRLYYYYEYVGTDIAASFRILSRNNGFVSFQSELNQYLVPQKDGFWDTMQEVFHTD
jgi:L-rhamnose mutarotase